MKSSNKVPQHVNKEAYRKLRRKARRRRRIIRASLLSVASLIVIALIGTLVWGGLSILFPQNANTGGDANGDKKPAQVAKVKKPHKGLNGEKQSSFTFTGVGDNLLHDTIFVYFEQDNGHRDFRELYANTKPYFQDTDLAYVNFETVCAGDEFGLSGYPSFNGPLEMMDALADSGFNWFSVSSNHSLDAGMAGLQKEISYAHERFPHISTTGAFVSEEEASTPVVREINGIRVGLASFTYGLNGYQKPEGADWLVDVYKAGEETIDYDLMERKLAELDAVSDVQIVSMHWGVEYTNDPTDEQREVARFLNEQGVEAIIGAHPHVIQPVEFIETPEQTTLVYYSLGNFISAQDTQETMVGGMARFKMNYDFNTQKASFENVQFIPTVTWISPDLRQYRTLTIREYNDDWAAGHFITAMGMDLTKAWVQDYTRTVCGSPENIEIVVE